MMARAGLGLLDFSSEEGRGDWLRLERVGLGSSPPGGAPRPRADRGAALGGAGSTTGIGRLGADGLGTGGRALGGVGSTTGIGRLGADGLGTGGRALGTGGRALGAGGRALGARALGAGARALGAGGRAWAGGGWVVVRGGGGWVVARGGGGGFTLRLLDGTGGTLGDRFALGGNRGGGALRELSSGIEPVHYHPE